jgi:hypothetical protein
MKESKTPENGNLCGQDRVMQSFGSSSDVHVAVVGWLAVLAGDDSP